MSEPSESILDLAELRDFATVVTEIRNSHANFGPTASGWTEADGLYCAVCGGRRRMSIKRLFWRASSTDGLPMEFTREGETPALFGLACMQCKTEAAVLVYAGPDGPDLAILSSERGGLSTPNTPRGVSYYLDQAYRAESISATSAATAMYRSAVEMLLFEQGYQNGMLNKKIDSLLADPNPPAWREQVDSEYLDVLKQLGNAAIHPNDGDVTKQSVLDRQLLAEIRVVFEELLDIVYERPAREAARKAKLRSASDAFVS